MRTPRQRTKRMQAVEEQLLRVEKWRLAELDRRLADLERRREDLLAALGGDGALRGLFLDALARGLVRVAREVGQTEAEKEAQLTRLIDQAARAVLAARLLERRQAEARRDAEARELLETIERYLARR